MSHKMHMLYKLDQTSQTGSCA